MDNPEAPAPHEENPKKYKQWFYDDVLRDLTELEKEAYVERGVRFSITRRRARRDWLPQKVHRSMMLRSRV